MACISKGLRSGVANSCIIQMVFYPIRGTAAIGNGMYEYAVIFQIYSIVHSPGKSLREHPVKPLMDYEMSTSGLF